MALRILESVNGDGVQQRFLKFGHGCGSSWNNLKLSGCVYLEEFG
jgi:hypothetical protein